MVPGYEIILYFFYTPSGVRETSLIPNPNFNTAERTAMCSNWLRSVDTQLRHKLTE